jgi:hypothetical protein
MASQAVLHFVLLTVLPSLAMSALAQEETRPSYSLRTNQVLPESIDKNYLSRGAPYPLDKRYEQFTVEERNTLRAYYEGMPETDEPPFPLDGMRYIVADIAKITGRLRAEGDVTIFVTVNETGEATGVKLVGKQDMEVAKVVAYVLVKAKYKPAKCSGTPCTQDFPFRFSLSTR